MGVAKKLGIVILIYILAGLVWSILRWQNIILAAGGLEGPMNILSLIFDPVTIIVFMILGAMGLM